MTSHTLINDRALDELLVKNGFNGPYEIQKIGGGANNRVYCLEFPGRKLLAKHYFLHPNDTRDRIASEYFFATFCWKQGVHSIPQPLASDYASRWALFDYLDGKPVLNNINEDLVIQAAEFFSAINHHRTVREALELPVASEAYFSMPEHVAGLSRRVDRLKNINSQEIINKEAEEFILVELVPHWLRTILKVDRTLAMSGRCLSPSDFGFHNALINASGTVRFFDFEYAGWDDPAKMICDFFCQPRIPVGRKYFETFVSTALENFPDMGDIVKRALALLPLYQVKWCCILLNEFLSVSNDRRVFSDASIEMEARKREQLQKAKELFQNIVPLS